MTSFDVTSATSAPFVNDNLFYGVGVSVVNVSSGVKLEDNTTDFTGNLLELGGNHNSGFDTSSGHYVMFKLPANVSGSMKVRMHPNSGSTTKNLVYKVGESGTENNLWNNNGNNIKSTTVNFSTTEETPVYIYIKSNVSSFRILSIQLTFNTPIVTLDNYGYATFASTSELDLTTANLATGVNAYKASISESTVNFTDVNEKVQANTGVLLKGSANQVFGIKLATGEGTDISASNAFLVNEAGTTFAGTDGYTYFGMLKNQSSLTFATFNPSSVAIPANKAYLKVLTSSLSSSHELTFVFDDDNNSDVTGVNEVRGQRSEVRGEYYNLAGQRVAQPTKGLYIVNGRKVVIK